MGKVIDEIGGFMEVLFITALLIVLSFFEQED